MSTRREIEEALLRGDTAASIQLDTPEKRRLLAFFLSKDSLPGAPFPDSYIQELKAAYANTACENEANESSEAPQQPQGACRLVRMETRNFGGLNRLGGAPFTLDVPATGLRVGGYNGKGKTSLASALVWGLTGARIISQQGPVEAASHPQPVFADDAAGEAPKAIGTWPPVLAYPNATSKAEIAEAQGTAQVILIFRDEGGQDWTVTRTITADGTMEAESFGSFGVPDILLELAVLMPNRIPGIRLGEGQNEADALVKLLGLEPLGQLADHVSDLHHSSKNFSKWPGATDIVLAQKAFQTKLGEATAKLTEAAGNAAMLAELHGDDPTGKEAECRRIAGELKIQAAKATSAVDSEIKPGATSPQVAAALARLEAAIRPDHLPETAGVLFLQALGANAKALSKLTIALPEFAKRYAVARDLRELALTDARLKIKAAAAEWHRETHGVDAAVSDCPLCEQALEGEPQRALGNQIQTLKEKADTARFTFGELCKSLVSDIAALAEPFTSHKAVKPGPDLGQWIADDLGTWLEKQADLAIALPRSRDSTIVTLRAALADLQAIDPVPTTPLADAPLPGEDDQIRAAFARAEVLVQVGAWWTAMEASVTKAWGLVIGAADGEGTFPGGTLAAALTMVAAAMAAAMPYADAATRLEDAADAAKTWKDQKDEREVRQAIRDSIVDLKKLKAFVADEATKTLGAVTERAREIFDGIYVADGLHSPWASLDKRESLAVTGRLHKGPTVDARWIANTSWLRAFLWSFYLAFREATVLRLGGNHLPLIVLDDPQTSFDLAHLRRWANRFATMQKEQQPHLAAQFVIASYDERFLDELARQGFGGGRIEVLGIDPDQGRLHVLSGDDLQQAWTNFATANDAQSSDARDKAQIFISRTREYVEGVMKLMLRGQGIEPTDKTVGGLTREFDGRKALPPFNFPHIRRFIDDLNNEKHFRDLLNKSHHHEDRKTLDEKDAKDVKATWDALKEPLNEAHHELQIFESIGLHLPDELSSPTTATLPAGFESEIKSLVIPIQGRVAAATNGQIAVMVENEGSTSLRFSNHGVGRLAVTHLAPVAKVGDLVVFRNHGAPKSGDLVVAAVGKRLCVGRLHLDPRNTGRMVLSPAGNTQPPLILPTISCQVRTIVAIAWHQEAPVGIAGSADDVIPLSAATELAPFIGDTTAWTVQGDSAEPLALNGQSILGGPRVTSKSAIIAADGKPVLAFVEGPTGEEAYFKRLRLGGGLAILENLNPQHDAPPIVAGLETTHAGLKLIAIAPVRGVRFCD